MKHAGMSGSESARAETVFIHLRHEKCASEQEVLQPTEMFPALSFQLSFISKALDQSHVMTLFIQSRFL